MHRTRSVLAASAILVLGSTSYAAARTGDPLVEGKRNGTTTAETSIVSNISGYSTRQSNKSNDGGGAIYGCRAAAGATPGAMVRPCIRANNLSTGQAFQFNTQKGVLGGVITVGAGGANTKPFTTNATGVADGLNADRLDGQEAADIVRTASTRWALVDESGAIIEQSGGFTTTSAYGAPNGPNNNPNVYLDAGEPLTDNGLEVSVAAQNRVNRDTSDPGNEPNFGGTVSVARCGEGLNATTCAPPGTNDANHLVVAPRIPTAPQGGGAITSEPTTASTRIRFYVTVTE